MGLLAGGVALVQLSSAAKEAKATFNAQDQSKVIGFSAALAACFISGFAGIYFEKVLKESDISVSNFLFWFVLVKKIKVYLTIILLLRC